VGKRRSRYVALDDGEGTGSCRSADFSLRSEERGPQTTQTEVCTPAKHGSLDRGSEAEIESLLAAVHASAKYRHVCEDLVRGVGARELAKGRSLKEAVKATKNRLHQIGGAYIARPIDYEAALAGLRAARESGDPTRWREACAWGMRQHASTRERLPILEQFYATVLADLRPIRSVLDLACGLNPLSIPWMPLAEGAAYHACDIYRDMVGFLNEFLVLAGLRGGVQAVDVTRACPDRHVELALLLKTLPCLDRLDDSVGPQVLDAINADHLLVSFPARSLGGRDKEMTAQYEARFLSLVEGRSWTVRRFEYASELAFLVSK
jgi:16S rRNA (guanine(1405)-N(7))-methyltransferase